MKLPYYILMLILLWIGGFLVGYGTRGIRMQSNYHYTPAVDLPEEWQAISTDSTKGTDLKGYVRNDSLFIQFNNK